MNLFNMREELDQKLVEDTKITLSKISEYRVFLTENNVKELEKNYPGYIILSHHSDLEYNFKTGCIGYYNEIVLLPGKDYLDL